MREGDKIDVLLESPLAIAAMPPPGVGTYDGYFIVTPLGTRSREVLGDGVQERRVFITDLPSMSPLIPVRLRVVTPAAPGRPGSHLRAIESLGRPNNYESVHTRLLQKRASSLGLGSKRTSWMSIVRGRKEYSMLYAKARKAVQRVRAMAQVSVYEEAIVKHMGVEPSTAHALILRMLLKSSSEGSIGSGVPVATTLPAPGTAWRLPFYFPRALTTCPGHPDLEVQQRDGGSVLVRRDEVTSVARLRTVLASKNLTPHVMLDESRNLSWGIRAISRHLSASSSASSTIVLAPDVAKSTGALNGMLEEGSCATVLRAESVLEVAANAPRASLNHSTLVILAAQSFTPTELTTLIEAMGVGDGKMVVRLFIHCSELKVRGTLLTPSPIWQVLSTLPLYVTVERPQNNDMSRAMRILEQDPLVFTDRQIISLIGGARGAVVYSDRRVLNHVKRLMPISALPAGHFISIEAYTQRPPLRLAAVIVPTTAQAWPRLRREAARRGARVIALRVETSPMPGTQHPPDLAGSIYSRTAHC